MPPQKLAARAADKLEQRCVKAIVLPASETTATGWSSGRCDRTSNTISMRWRTAYGSCVAIQ
jgi:hypothetical protein